MASAAATKNVTSEIRDSSSRFPSRAARTRSSQGKLAGIGDLALNLLPFRRPQYLEQRPEHDRGESDPAEDAVEIVELLGLEIDVRHGPGQGFATARNAEGHPEQEQDYDTDQVQE